MSKTVIQVENLIRDFQMAEESLRVLKGINFEIEEGEFVTIMGASGSGKSTLLNILGCLDQATDGLYRFDGQPIRDMSRNELAHIRNRKIGFVFQSYNLLPRTTALENVELPLLYNTEVSSMEVREKALEAIELVGLSDRMWHKPSQLSGGQQQRVAIARCLVNQPRVILADEATGNLDTKTSYEIMSIFQDLNAQGKTIIFVTHEQEIASFSSRTITLRDGMIISDKKRTHIEKASKKLMQYQS